MLENPNRAANTYSNKRLNKLAPVVAGLLAIYSGEAKATWQCGIDIDEATDGSSMGTNYNDGSIVYTLVGERGGLSFRSIDDGSGSNTTNQRTTDGISFEDITADIQASHADLSSDILVITGYNPNNDEMLVRNFTDDNYWIVSGVSGSSMSGVELLGDPNADGSIDLSTGQYIGSYYVSSSLRADVYSYSSTAAPTEIYSRSGYDWQPQADLANDRLFVMNDSYQTYEVTDVYGAKTRTEMTDVSNAYGVPVHFLPNSYSASGYDEFYYQNASYAIEYCYDDSSAVATDTDSDGVSDDTDLCSGTTDTSTVDSDGCSDSQRDDDGDGYTDDSGDCDDTNANAYPGNGTVSEDDGVDNDCDGIDVPSVSVSLSASSVGVDESVSVSADVGDDETLDSALSVSWSLMKDGVEVDSTTGTTGSFTPSEAGTYSVVCTVTDTDGYSTSSETTFEAFNTLDSMDTGMLDTGYYYEDPSDPEEGYIYVASNGISNGGSSSYSISNGGIISLYHTEAEVEAEDAGVSVSTYDASTDLTLLLGISFAVPINQDYCDDCTVTDQRLAAELREGKFDVLGQYTDSVTGDFELDETITYSGSGTSDYYYLADIVDTIEEETDADTDVDTDTDGDSDTDGDTDGDADSDTDSDADGDADSDGDSDADGDADNDTGSTPPPDCSGCSSNSELPNPWSLAVGGAVLGSTVLKRRKK